MCQRTDADSSPPNNNKWHFNWSVKRRSSDIRVTIVSSDWIRGMFRSIPGGIESNLSIDLVSTVVITSLLPLSLCPFNEICHSTRSIFQQVKSRQSPRGSRRTRAWEKERETTRLDWLKWWGEKSTWSLPIILTFTFLSLSPLSSSVTRSCLDKFTTPPPSCHDRVNLRIQPRNHHVRLPFSLLSLNARIVSIRFVHCSDRHGDPTESRENASIERYLQSECLCSRAFPRHRCSRLVYHRSISLLSDEHSEMAEFSASQSLVQRLFHQDSASNGSTRQRQSVGFAQQVSEANQSLLCLMMEIKEAHSMCFDHR